MNLLKPFALAFAAACLPAAHAQTVVVNANADLWNTPGSGQQGAAAVAIDVTGLSSITFSVSAGATVTVDGGNIYEDADGTHAMDYIAGTSTISGITAPTAGFVTGAFVGSTLGTAPAALDFTVGGTSFASLSPLLQQAFFIGDGLTGDGSGATQTFYVPVGATTLYLGIADACNFSGSPSCFGDNYGSFTVTATGNAPVAAVPEPATYALLSGGLGLVGWIGRRRAR